MNLGMGSRSRSKPAEEPGKLNNKESWVHAQKTNINISSSAELSHNIMELILPAACPDLVEMHPVYTLQSTRMAHSNYLNPSSGCSTGLSPDGRPQDRHSSRQVTGAPISPRSSSTAKTLHDMRDGTVIGEQHHKTFSKKVMESLWRQAADMVLLWAELYWMDNVTDHCLEREGGGGYQGLCGFDSEKEKEMGGNERVQECATAVLSLYFTSSFFWAPQPACSSEESELAPLDIKAAFRKSEK
ncbi:hypothetical protein NQZ68_003527 [Dissostichus eleginoides]|nr:hypothetical protein NQZ68_003527 [Dissostichus eleginoides]